MFTWDLREYCEIPEISLVLVFAPGPFQLGLFLGRVHLYDMKLKTSPVVLKYFNIAQSRPQSLCPLDQRSGSAWALVESKTGTRKFWFRFNSACASEIVVEMNKFQQPMRFGHLFGGLSV